MKNILSFIMLSLCTAFVACSDNDDSNSYDPDTAKSAYSPLPGRKVASLKTTYTRDGRDYSCEHNFSYDAQGRVKDISSRLVRYVKYYDGKSYLCNITSKATYIYKGDELEIDYSISSIYPDALQLNDNVSGKDRGIFTATGYLSSFVSDIVGVGTDFIYSANGRNLTEAYSDGGVTYVISRDNKGNITGYRRNDENNGEVAVTDRSGNLGYSPTNRNNTNFDFSGYFGYWGVEERFYATQVPFYAAYQLAAFGMLGSTSPYLPSSEYMSESGRLEDGDWEFDSRGCPLSYESPTGPRTEITYVD